MEHAKHIVRAVLLLVLIAVAFVVVREFAIPESFGLHGHYRFGSVADYASKLPLHGDPGMCAECHAEQGESWSAGKHSAVSCEVCHAPLNAFVEPGKTHVNEEGEWQATMPANRSFKLCAWCHQSLVARPKGFPQVVLPDHVIENGAEMDEEVCLECHDDPHNPSG